MVKNRDSRRGDIDALRIGACYLLFVFHTAMVFNPAPFFHVQNDETSIVFLVLAGFIGLWHMPLLFLLAGWSLAGSIEGRGVGGFVKQRLLKLGVPLVIGSAVMGPVMKYVELRGGQDLNHTGLYVSAESAERYRQIIPSELPAMAPFHESFAQFLPTFFTDLDRFSWGHLWFIAYLLTFSLIYLPVFIGLARREVRPVSRPRLWVYLPALPLALIQVLLRPHWPGIQNLYNDWANFAFYTTFLFAGLLLARHPEVEDAVRAERYRSFAVAVAVALVLLLAVVGVLTYEPVVLAGSGIAGWYFVASLLGFARERAAHRPAPSAYLRDSAFPVYLLHQFFIVVIGWGVVQLSLGIAVKFTLILLGAVVATMAVYHFVLRRSGVARVLAGMSKVAPARAQIVTPHGATATLVVALVVAPASTVDAGAGSPLGRWYAEGGAAQVEISECDDALCGEVVWLRSPFDEHGCAVRDQYNADPALRERPVIGLRLLHDAEPSPNDAAVWEGGSIYDPTSGRTYRCRLELVDDDHLSVRGFIGIPLLGRTTTWLRVGAEERVCRR